MDVGVLAILIGKGCDQKLLCYHIYYQLKKVNFGKQLRKRSILEYERWNE